MKKTLPFLAVLCLLLNHLQAQVIFSDDFETDFETNGWTNSPVWQIGNSITLSSTDFNVPPHTQFAGVNDDGPGQGVASMGSLVTTQFDLTGIPAVLLQFDAYFVNGDYDADETARVLISTDSMATWQVLHNIEGSGAWQQINLYLNDGVAGEKVHLAFEYDDNDGWNFGFCVDNVLLEVAPDYAAQVELKSQLTYTIQTARQFDGQPLQFVHRLANNGIQPLDSISLEMEAIIIGQGTQAAETHILSLIPGESALDTFSFLPTEIGKYTIQVKASHSQIGQDFYQKLLVNAFELSDSIMARDDGERDISIGMSFGDPNWYGYYGSEFQLPETDTLTGISVWMSTAEAGSFNLTVNGFEGSNGLPTQILYNSSPIEINAGYNDWVYHPLTSELPLAAGTYVFCAGQDTIQGVMGHGFDQDRKNLGYWIMSPVAGGGYPWTSYDSPTDEFNWTLMIRPHFKLQATPNAVGEVFQPMLKVFPNPASTYLYFDFPHANEPVEAALFNAAGQLVHFQQTTSNGLHIDHLTPGLYFLKVQDGKRTAMAKVFKN